MSLLSYAIINACKYSKFLSFNLNNNININLLETIIIKPIDNDFFCQFKNWEKLINDLNEEEISKNIRQLRLLVFAHILIRDINNLSNFKEVTNTITKFADFAVNILLKFSFNFYKNIYGHPIGNDSNKIQNLSVIAMGKMGGFELNVSSDIDLVFTYPESGQTNRKKHITNEQFFTKVAKKLIKLLNENTQYGKVFRVDVRLRPNGDSGSLVINETSLENYLIIHGSQWERFAWMKARLISNYPNNIEQIINPFIYKKYSDFSVYDSLRDLHKQIKFEASKNDYLNNIKIGIGGIREIEFITQMFQLISGGKLIELQVQSTQQALKILKKLNILDKKTSSFLLDTYVFLRNVEHRLQYWNDQQTHNLPNDEQQQNLLANSMGFNTYSNFLKTLNKYQKKVHNIFDNLLINNNKNENNLQLQQIWLNDIDLPNKIKILKKYKFQDTNLIIEKLLQTKDSFRYKSLSNASKKSFDNLIPKVIEVASNFSENDKCLLRLLKFFEIIARRASYLALIDEHSKILKKLANIMNKSKLITEILYKYPILLDEILNNELLNVNFDWNLLSNEIENKLQWYEKKDIELQMNLLRDFQHTQIFKLAIQDMENLWKIENLSDQLSFLADTIIKLAVKQTWNNFQKKYIQIPKFAVIGYGKLGSKELSYSSDLDLVYIFDDNNANAMQIYINFANRLTSFISTTTSSGVLYNVDLRLRPNGDSGYIASSITMFEKYQLENAWDWEHQSLSKARFICGDDEIKIKFENLKFKILSQKRNLSDLKQSMLNMRNKISIANKNKNNIKYLRGGLIDVEFIVQYIVLAQSCKYNQLLNNFGNIALLDIAAKLNIVETSLANKVQESYRFYRNLINKNIILDQQLEYNPQDLINYCLHVKLLWFKVFGETI